MKYPNVRCFLVPVAGQPAQRHVRRRSNHGDPGGPVQPQGPEMSVPRSSHTQTHKLCILDVHKSEHEVRMLCFLNLIPIFFKAHIWNPF